IFALLILLTEPPNLLGSDPIIKDAQPVTAKAAAYYTEPSVSPDGSEIAFVSASDIWTVPAAGGEARLLVSNAAVESRPIYSPDGRRLAFVSTRTGNGDIYVLTFETGESRRLTFDDGYDLLNGWSGDGRWIYFSSTSGDIGTMHDILRVSAEGGTPMPVSADRYTSEYFAAPSPDGRTLAFTARGIAPSQWWRKGHSHLDESEIWLMREGAPGNYKQLTKGAKELWPMWGADGHSIFYVSDRSGAQNVWKCSLDGQARQVTQFKDGRVLWPTISYDGRVIVFERDFGIWKLDTGSGRASRIPVSTRGAFATPSREHFTYSSQIQEMKLSPDGRKVAFVIRGEIFAASKDGGNAARVTRSVASESQINWSPDSNSITYVSDRGEASRIYLYDFRTKTETQLTQGSDEYSPSFSPDGKLIAFARKASELRVLDLDSKQERLLATASLGRPPFMSERWLTWSPDGKWVAFLAVSNKLFKNAYVVPTEGGQSLPVSFLANNGSRTLSWSPDGSFLIFVTGQRVEDGQLARVDLKPRAPKFPEDQFQDLFKDNPKKPASPDRQEQQNPKAGSEAQGPQKEGASKQVEVIFDGVRQRLALLPVGLDVGFQTVSPDGKWALVTASAAGQQNLYLYPLNTSPNEPAAARQVTSTTGYKEHAQFSPDGKEVYYLENGRINIATLESRQSRPLPITAEIDVDFNREKVQIFNQAWSHLRDGFFDKNFNGVNWESVRAAYAPYIAGAQTRDELRRLILLMLGELNASHMGLTPPQGASYSVGKLGLKFDRVEYENKGALRVEGVIPLGPSALASGIKSGNYLLAIDGQPVNSGTNIDELLGYTINRRVLLTVADSADGANRREVAVQPSSLPAEKSLRYAEWVEHNRAYVAELSGGRLGYVHMFDMSSESLAKLSVDLDAENQSREGVVIDLRNNTGGFVNVHALDIFARRGYLTMTTRGLPPGPARAVLGQRALELPTILVVNQHSLSDAEEFAEGYRALGLGKIVGEPTGGWVIYTPVIQLVDGSTLRVPNTSITANDGTALEMNPRPVDVQVVRPVGESYSDDDAQLNTAVRQLLRQIGDRENPDR
ncbi:MAG TPA: LpqB family beta-propeller domain-containing protein, partial [Blastocatellia bacterium]|nr:LpqB family beta-propeller domain-containing protein [Blastocatellia bacterium]